MAAGAGMGAGMNNFSTLIKRLEAATSRLEDIAASTSAVDVAQPNVKAVSDEAETPSVNGDHPLSRSAPLGASGSQQPAKTQLPPSVEAFDSLVEEEVKTFSDIAEKLGGTVLTQSTTFADAFRSQREVLLVASKAKAPSETSPIFQDLLQPIIKGITGINDLRDQKRKSPEENHLSMIADGCGILSWVTIKPAPDKYVAEVLGGAQFYGNKIMMSYKGKDTPDVDWVKSFVKLCGALVTYIKEHHGKGLDWNPNGVDAAEALNEVRSMPKTNGTSAPAGAVAPPPPPPPLPQFDAPPPPPQPGVRSPAASGDMGAVFADLNRGESVTSGLRKVEKSEMTHKNPALRAQGSTPTLDRSDSSSSTGRGKSPQPPAKKQKPESMRTKKPPKKELDGNKWIVENFENEQQPIEIDAEKHQSILVLKCKGVTIKVNGKANAISLDNCAKTDMLIESLVSSVDAVNCINLRMQVTGTLPSVQLDKVDVGTIFLSKDSLNCEVYTSKCSSINITLPPLSEQDDSVECPVPEQIKSSIVDGKLVNEIVKHEG